METITLKIVGSNLMNCGGCERSVQTALMDVNGVQNVTADRETQDVVVTTQGGVSVATLTQELAEIGYQANVA
jgi:copper chaperone CopZ